MVMKARFRAFWASASSESVAGIGIADILINRYGEAEIMQVHSLSYFDESYPACGRPEWWCGLILSKHTDTVEFLG